MDQQLRVGINANLPIRFNGQYSSIHFCRYGWNSRNSVGIRTRTWTVWSLVPETWLRNQKREATTRVSCAYRTVRSN